MQNFKKKTIKIGYDTKLTLDTQKLYKNINSKVSLIIISNPNSPTGTVLNLNEIKKILEKAKKYKIKVVIDEAYFGFSLVTACPLIKRFKNLIVLRTFSKAYGLAGLRIGYAISNPANIEELTNIKPMYEVNSLAILGLIFFLTMNIIEENI